jgi:hypothetical protein
MNTDTRLATSEAKQGDSGSATASHSRTLYLSMMLLIFLFSAIASASAQQCDPTSNCDVEDGGGPIMQEPMTVFLIFWLPGGFNYDTSITNGDTSYENLMARFFTDLSGSSYFSILTQYPGTCGSGVPSSQSCFGGITATSLPVDTSPYTQFTATSVGTAAKPLQDSDIQQEVQKIITQNGITPGLNTEFIVFTGAGVQECLPMNVCTTNFFCAYHSSTTTPAGATVVYTYMPQDNALGSGCSSGISTSPNNQIAADEEIVVMSHEFFESVSDPVSSSAPNTIGWISNDPSSQSAPGEIGDNCNQELGSLQSNGQNLTLNGNPYVAEQIWSNDDAACALSFDSPIPGPSIEYTFGVGGDDLRGDSSATSALQDATGSAFQNVTLKTQSQSSKWKDSSTQVRVFQLNQPSPPPVPSALANVAVTLTSHDSGAETPDNWNIQNLDVKLRNPNGSVICDQSMSGSPLARLTGQAPTAIFATPNCAPPTPPTSFTSVAITIGTGHDNARSDTELWATFSGEPALCLKPSNNADPDGVCNNGGSAHDLNGKQSWENFTTSAQTFVLPAPSTLASATLTILMIEHNSGFEGDDNWDIQNIAVSGIDSGGNSTLLLSMSNPFDSNHKDNCLARLKGSPNPSQVTYNLSAASPGGSNLSNPTFGATPPGSCPQ